MPIKSNSSLFKGGKLVGNQGPKSALDTEDTYSEAVDGQGEGAQGERTYGIPQDAMPVMEAESGPRVVAPVLTPEQEAAAAQAAATRKKIFEDFENGRQRATLLERYFKIEDVEGVNKKEALSQYTLSCVGNNKGEITVESIKKVVEEDLRGLWNIDQSKKGALLGEVAKVATRMFDISDLKPATLHLSQVAQGNNQREKNLAIKRLDQAASKDFGGDKVRAQMHVIDVVAKVYDIPDVAAMQLISAARATVLNPDEQQAGLNRIAEAQRAELAHRWNRRAAVLAQQDKERAQRDAIEKAREDSSQPGANDHRKLSDRAAAFAAAQNQGRNRAGGIFAAARSQGQAGAQGSKVEGIYDTTEQMNTRADQQGQGVNADTDAPPPVTRGPEHAARRQASLNQDTNNAAPPRPSAPKPTHLQVESQYESISNLIDLGAKPGTSPSGPSATFEGVAMASVLANDAVSQVRTRQTSAPDGNMARPEDLLAELGSSRSGGQGGGNSAENDYAKVDPRARASDAQVSKGFSGRHAPKEPPPTRSNIGNAQGQGRWRAVAANIKANAGNPNERQ